MSDTGTDLRRIRVELFTGLGTANVYVVDGDDRQVGLMVYAVGVKTREDAIRQARGARPELFEGAHEPSF
jgi:hypothetical protein